MSNKDRWSALSMSERADLINKYVSGGIVDLAEIKRHYNSFGGGGNTKKKKKGFTPIKDLAYKMASDARVSSRGHATVKDIIRILTSSDESQELDDNKMTYIYGNISGLPPAEGSNGKDYSKYLEDKHPIKHWLGKIKEYQGVLNPYNEYVVDERDRGLIEELARKGKGLYSNADTEYSYMADAYDPEVQPYRDDVSSYHMQFVNTPNGPAISSSDLYDFGPDYDSSKYDREDGGSMLSRLEAMAMDVVGNPYILRQDNIPIRFISTKDDSLEWEEVERAESLRDAIEYGMLSVKDRQEGVNIDQKIAEVLETGYIEPAEVVADRKKSYGGLLANRFDGGGDSNNNGNYTFMWQGQPNAVSFPYLPTREQAKVQANAYKVSKEGLIYDDNTGEFVETKMTPQEEVEYKRIIAGFNPRGAYQITLPAEEAAAKKQMLERNKNIKGSYSINKDKSEADYSKTSEAKQFLFDWYNHPATRAIVEQQGKTPDKLYRWEDLEDGYKKAVEVSREDPYTGAVDMALEATPAYADLQSENPNRLGVYDMHGNHVRVDNTVKGTREEVPLWIHEYNHAVQEGLNIYRDAATVPYAERNQEIQSNLMSIRKQFGLNPGKRNYTADEAQKMIEEMKKWGYDDNGNMIYDGAPSSINFFMQQFNDGLGITAPQLARYLNTMADASNVIDSKTSKIPAGRALSIPSYEEEVYYAANGGFLKKMM